MLAPLKPRIIRARARQYLERAHLDDRSAAAHADEQLGPRGCGESRPSSWCTAASGAPRAIGIATTASSRRLKTLTEEETLLVQSGKPVGVFPTHADAPRVLIANSNLVPHWATWEHFHELDRKGLAMFGQMTAGSWIYIGSQGIVQGTYETFAEMGRRHFGGNLAGKWILTAGLGGMGGAQPLAATMAGASLLAVECRPSRIAKRLETGYVDAPGAHLG